MSAYISKAELTKAVYLSMHDNPHKDGKLRVNHSNEHMHFVHMIYHAPCADVRPVVHAKWVKKQQWGAGRWHKWLECSACGHQDHDADAYEAMPFVSPGNYCSECGATMDLKEEGTDE